MDCSAPSAPVQQLDRIASVAFRDLLRNRLLEDSRFTRRACLNLSDIAVLRVVCQHVDRDGGDAVLSRQTIANRTSLSVDTVKRVVNRLADPDRDGGAWLVVEARFEVLLGTRQRRQAANRYRLRVPSGPVPTLVPETFDPFEAVDRSPARPVVAAVVPVVEEPRPESRRELWDRTSRQDCLVDLPRIHVRALELLTGRSIPPQLAFAIGAVSSCVGRDEVTGEEAVKVGAWARLARVVVNLDHDARSLVSSDPWPGAWPTRSRSRSPVSIGLPVASVGCSHVFRRIPVPPLRPAPSLRSGPLPRTHREDSARQPATHPLPTPRPAAPTTTTSRRHGRCRPLGSGVR